jgi:prevent-host-death family protein
MTPPDRELKREVGVRELRDRLNRYVEHAGDGGEVVVTVRGRPVAKLVPAHDPLAELRARGLVRDPIGPKLTAEELRKMREDMPKNARVSDFIDRDR